MARTEQTPRPQRDRPGFGAGGEGWDGSEDASNPTTSAQQHVQDEGDARSDAQGAVPHERDEAMQSDYALSQSSDEAEADGRYGVAEEQNFDQQSDAARRVGQLPEQGPAAQAAGAMQQDNISKQDRAELEKSIARAVPKSE